MKVAQKDARGANRCMSRVFCAEYAQKTPRGTWVLNSYEMEIIGYCCIIIGDEPAYHQIEGAWKTDNPYAVVHRMAFNKKARGGGLSKEAFHLLKKYCISCGIGAIRVDTQKENKVMQHILIREGFRYCGLIQFDGGPKLAYEWDE